MPRGRALPPPGGLRERVGPLFPNGRSWRKASVPPSTAFRRIPTVPGPIGNGGKGVVSGHRRGDGEGCPRLVWLVGRGRLRRRTGWRLGPVRPAKLSVRRCSAKGLPASRKRSSPSLEKSDESSALLGESSPSQTLPYRLRPRLPRARCQVTWRQFCESWELSLTASGSISQPQRRARASVRGRRSSSSRFAPTFQQALHNKLCTIGLKYDPALRRLAASRQDAVGIFWARPAPVAAPLVTVRLNFRKLGRIGVAKPRARVSGAPLAYGGTGLLLRLGNNHDL